MTTTSSCESCGMPIESGRYCGYCTDDSGALQSFEERFARMAAWQARRDPAASKQDIERQVLDTTWPPCQPGASIPGSQPRAGTDPDDQPDAVSRPPCG